ncbi:MAG: division plane positioning ATPase MipZ [Sulfurimonas sp.]|nr:division plane positioning ATPase MipZ [Sulfurimonas sp.]
MEKQLKFLVANAKGGAGKSTTSMQIIVPYLFRSSKKQVFLYEFDDENEDSKSYADSRIVKTEQVKVDSNNMRDELQKILLKDETLCIDVGANKTASTVISALNDSGMIFCIDLAIIPMMDGEIDAVSALNMYIMLKEAHPDLKIIFALGRVNMHRDIFCQFDIFLGDQRGFFNEAGMIQMVKEEDRIYFPVHDSDAIKYSRQFGSTVWELAKVNRDIDTELKNAILNNDTPQEIKFLSFKRGLRKDCTTYLEKTIIPAFKALNKRLVLANDE